MKITLPFLVVLLQPLSAGAAVRCAGDLVNPGPVQPCFHLELSLTIIPGTNQFSETGKYLGGMIDGHRCGGWPPFFEPIAGQAIPSAAGSIALSAPGYQANLDLEGDRGFLTENGMRYELRCDSVADR